MRGSAGFNATLLRLFRVLLNGLQKNRSHSKAIRERLAWEAAPLRSTYAGAVWAMKKYYHDNPQLLKLADTLLTDIYAEFGWMSRLAAPLIGRYVFSRLKREETLLADGHTYEPRSFCEENVAAVALKKTPAVMRPYETPELTNYPFSEALEFGQ